MGSNINQHVVEAAISGRKGKFCVAARNIITGEEILFNADELCPTASVFKVPVLVELLRRYELGEISLDSVHVLREDDKCPGSGILKEMTPGMTLTVKDLATLMIIISDNTATDLLVGMLGVDNITATMRNFGLKNTYITMGCKGILAHFVGIKKAWPTHEEVRLAASRMAELNVDEDSIALKGVPENNTTTPRDMVDLLEQLHKGKLLGEKGTAIAIDIMKRQQLRYRIPALLPPGTITATKSGTLSNRVMNDVGLVYPRQGDPYAIAIFTSQEPGPNAESSLANISLAVYEHYQQKKRM